LFHRGQNANYELGINTGEEKEIKEPQIVQLPGNKPVRMIGCGFEHSVCITMENTAFSWGSGLLGILGHKSDINREEPTQIDLHWSASTPADAKEKLVWVACGPHNTGIVCQGRADRKQIYTFGAGEYGTLGNGTKIPSLQPQLIHVEDTSAPISSPSDRFPQIDQVTFGTNHTVAVASNGTCWSFGSNKFGQLGYVLEDQDTSADDGSSEKRGNGGDRQLIPRLVGSLHKNGIKVTSASCGELSTSVLTSTGAVYSWGSGETHQLGIMDNVSLMSAALCDDSELHLLTRLVWLSCLSPITTRL
jgi:alpha-tubulin suppressor-like RCC1 family protein